MTPCALQGRTVSFLCSFGLEEEKRALPYDPLSHSSDIMTGIGATAQRATARKMSGDTFKRRSEKEIKSEIGEAHTAAAVE
mmetsp:Transcript_7335/g.14348  ORF Transcript_7335/g.14348 Transcript_7335/m.14348 type:complete len:81 (+) Transcript_7335:174-416(+)